MSSQSDWATWCLQILRPNQTNKSTHFLQKVPFLTTFYYHQSLTMIRTVIIINHLKISLPSVSSAFFNSSPFNHIRSGKGNVQEKWGCGQRIGRIEKKQHLIAIIHKYVDTIMNEFVVWVPHNLFLQPATERTGHFL